MNQSTLLDANGLFKEFKGALTEQYVLQQLKTLKRLETYYWTNDCGGSEIDFVVDNGDMVIPIGLSPPSYAPCVAHTIKNTCRSAGV